MLATGSAGIASLIQTVVNDERVRLAERVLELKAFARPQVE